MGDVLEVSAQTARRFVLGKQGLWPGRRWAGKEGTRQAMIACEHLQLDPLVIIARSHDLMLHARVLDYRPEYFHQLTYEERAFFDWGGWLAVRPMEELPYWRVVMQRSGDHPEFTALANEHPDVLEEMREALHTRGTVANRDFASTGRRAVESYRGSKDSSLALYYLWRTGEAMTHHREGFERVYAPAEAVAPAHLLDSVSVEEAERYLAKKQIAFAGIGRAGPLRRLLARTISKKEEQALEARLLEAGEIARVRVAGWRGTHYALAADIPLLEEVARGGVPSTWQPGGPTTEEEAVFLSPLDPVSARGRAKALFDFDYTWEIYKPAADMLFGRYVMPVLWGDRLVGRIDPRLDRATKTLVINGAWFEDEAGSREERLLDALAAATSRLMTFVEARRVDASAVKDARVRKRLRAIKG